MTEPNLSEHIDRVQSTLAATTSELARDLGAAIAEKAWRDGYNAGTKSSWYWENLARTLRGDAELAYDALKDGDKDYALAILEHMKKS